MYWGIRKFRIGNRRYGIQGLVFRRPRAVFTYDDGDLKWRDFGPIRIYRYLWRERVAY